MRSYETIAEQLLTQMPKMRNLPALAGKEHITLNDMGFGVVGSGCYGLVLEHGDEPDVVFKLCCRSYDAYAAYVAWARAHAGAPHIIDVLYVCRYPGRMVVVLPRYEEAHDFRDDVGIDVWDDMNNLARDGLGAYNPSEGTRSVLGVGYSDFIGYEDLLPIQQVALDIGDYFRGIADMDLHKGNIMYDPLKGEYIITDPVSASHVGDTL